MRLPFIVFFAGVLLIEAPVTHAQSLADVARKESERRQGNKAPTKVITNKDLKPVALPPPSPDTAAPASNTPAADDKKADGPVKNADDPASNAKAEPKTKSESKDEAYWRKRKKDLQDRLSEDRLFLDALQSRLNALNTDFVNRDDPAQRAKIAADRDRASSEMDRLRKAIVDDTKAITAFEEEARGAGVPPGWLR